jgi:transposase
MFGEFVVEVGVSLRPMDPREVPELTARVARAAFPSGTAAMRVRDVLGQIFTDGMFRDAFPSRGEPALSPARLALVSVLQFAEGLADRQAADAVRARIDWKYALGLELTDPGFDYSVLSEFRSRLIDGRLEQAVFTAVVDAARASGLVKARGKQRTDSTHVITAVREVNRLERCIETMRAALNALSVLAPAWVAALADAEWFDRYSDRPEQYRLPAPGTRKRIALAEQVGADGSRLMTAVFAGDAPAHLRQVEAVEVLRQTWVQEYAITSTDDGQERIVWRHPKDCPPGAVRLASPYDTDARNAVKRDTSWSGYKVHLTETCVPGEVHLITHVATTVATTPDTGMIAEVHRDLAQRDLLPSVYLADAGYVNAPHLVSARRDHDVTLIGPVQASTVRKADSGFGPSAFTIDWDTRTATCPGGQTTTNWREATSHRGTPRQPGPVPEDPVRALPGPQSVHHVTFPQPHPAPTRGARSTPVGPS